MKYTIGLIMTVAAIGSSAQSLADLPECGQTCIQNMLDKANELGCEVGDAGCLCQNVDFSYGIRDCSSQACKGDSQAIIDYGSEYCKSEGNVVFTTAGPGPDSGNTANTTPGTDDSANTPFPESSAGGPKSTGGPATSTTSTHVVTSSGTASSSPTKTNDNDPTETDDEGGIGGNAAVPAGLLVAAGVVAIFI